MNPCGKWRGGRGCVLNSFRWTSLLTPPRLIPWDKLAEPACLRITPQRYTASYAQRNRTTPALPPFLLASPENWQSPLPLPAFFASLSAKKPIRPSPLFLLSYQSINPSVVFNCPEKGRVSFAGERRSFRLEEERRVCVCKGDGQAVIRAHVSAVWYNRGRLIATGALRIYRPVNGGARKRRIYNAAGVKFRRACNNAPDPRVSTVSHTVIIFPKRLDESLCRCPYKYRNTWSSLLTLNFFLCPFGYMRKVYEKV